jgi:hypothetical protein
LRERNVGSLVLDLFFLLIAALRFAKSCFRLNLGTDTKYLCQIEVCILCHPFQTPGTAKNLYREFIDKGKPEQSLSLLQI